MKGKPPIKNADESPLASVEHEPTGWLSGIGLPFVLAICIIIALILTSISMALYFSSNLSRIDLSKPKYAGIRRDLLPAAETSDQEDFDTDSPITRESVDEAIKEMQRRRNDLQNFGAFNSPVLDDAQLGIDPAQ